MDKTKYDSLKENLVDQLKELLDDLRPFKLKLNAQENNAFEYLEEVFENTTNSGEKIIAYDTIGENNFSKISMIFSNRKDDFIKNIENQNTRKKSQITGKDILKIFLTKEVEKKAAEIFSNKLESINIPKNDITFQLKLVNEDQINFGFMMMDNINNVYRFNVVGIISRELIFKVMPKYQEEFTDIEFDSLSEDFDDDSNIDNKEDFEILVEYDVFTSIESALIEAFSFEAYQIAKLKKDAEEFIFEKKIEFVRAYDGDVNVFYNEQKLGCYFINSNQGIGFEDSLNSIGMRLGNSQLLSCIN